VGAGIVSGAYRDATRSRLSSIGTSLAGSGGFHVRLVDGTAADMLEVIMPGDETPAVVIDGEGYAEARFRVDLGDPVKAAGRIAAVLAAAAEGAG
jgi:hypothetical protein